MAFPTQKNGMVSGLLRRSEKKKIAERLATKGASDPTCELCGTKSWQIGDYFVTPAGLARHPAGSFYPAPGDPWHPSFTLFCVNCGNTKLINGAILGAFELLNPDGEEGDDAG